jgi:CheY-like chemotaxis protein
MARILVVDDNRMIRSILSDILQGAGHPVETAENGLMALELSKLSHPDLIILDYYMPVMDGEEFILELKRLGGILKNVPIIGLAGTKDAEKHLMEAGADLFIAKPFKEEQLVEAIDRLLAGRS